MMRTQPTPSRVLVLLAGFILGVLLLLATASAATGSSEPPPVPESYVVQQGDNLWSIADAAYGDDIDTRQAIHDIKKLNGLANAGVAVGQVLLIPAA